MLLHNLFHEFPHSDPIVYHSSSGEGFPAFLFQDESEEMLMLPPATHNQPFLILSNLTENQVTSTDSVKKLVSTNLTTNQVPYKSATLLVDSPIYINGSLVAVGGAPGGSAQLEVTKATGPVYFRVNAPTGEYALMELSEDELNPWQILKKPTTHELQFWNTDYWMTLTTAGVLNLKQLTPSKVVVTDANRNLVSGSNTDTEIADAVSRKDLSWFIDPPDPSDDLPMIPPGVSMVVNGKDGQTIFMLPDEPEEPLFIPGTKGDPGEKGDKGDSGEGGSGGTGAVLCYEPVDPPEDLPMIPPGVVVQGPQGNPGPVFFLDPDQPEEPIVIPGPPGPAATPFSLSGFSSHHFLEMVDPPEDLPMLPYPSQRIDPGGSLTLVGLNLSSLTASLPVVTDASKNLASLAYTGATSFRKNLGLETTDTPAFLGLSLTAPLNLTYTTTTNVDHGFILNYTYNPASYGVCFAQNVSSSMTSALTGTHTTMLYGVNINVTKTGADTLGALGIFRAHGILTEVDISGFSAGGSHLGYGGWLAAAITPTGNVTAVGVYAEGYTAGTSSPGLVISAFGGQFTATGGSAGGGTNTTYGIWATGVGGTLNYAAWFENGLVNIQNLTASLPIVTDASKNLVSLAYTGSTSFRKNLGLETNDSPVFLGLRVSGLGGGVLEAVTADATGNLGVTSFIGFTSPTSLRKLLGLETDDTPIFAALTVQKDQNNQTLVSILNANDGVGDTAARTRLTVGEDAAAACLSLGWSNQYYTNGAGWESIDSRKAWLLAGATAVALSIVASGASSPIDFYAGGLGAANKIVVISSGGLSVTAPATPAAQQIKATANGAGGVGLMTYATDNEFLLYDCEWTGSYLVARNATAALIHKYLGKLLFQGDSGLTPGVSYTPAAPKITLDLTSGKTGFGMFYPQAKVTILSEQSATVNDLMFTYNDGGDYRNGIANHLSGGASNDNYITFRLCDGTTTGQVSTMTLTGAGRVGIGFGVPLQKLQIGSNSAVSSATPDAISLGGTYSNTAGANIKLRVFDDGGTAIYGLGISAGSLDYVVPTSQSHNWYVGTTRVMHMTSSTVTLPNLPTSSTGLAAGDIWNNGGVLCIV